jgi:hypothetical protein
MHEQNENINQRIAFVFLKELKNSEDEKFSN